MTCEPNSRTTQDRIRRLLSPERAESLDPLRIFAYCDINHRDTVAEIGCGPGYFTVPLAKELVSGKLYALDLDDEMLTACRDTVAKARLGNVEILKCDEFEFPLEAGILNGAFLAFVTQQSPDKPRFIRAVRELIGPRGWCTILEWYRKETEGGPPLDRRVDPMELEIIAQEAGFQPRGWLDLNGRHYLMNLRNP